MSRWTLSVIGLNNAALSILQESPEVFMSPLDTRKLSVLWAIPVPFAYFDDMYDPKKKTYKI